MKRILQAGITFVLLSCAFVVATTVRAQEVTFGFEVNSIQSSTDARIFHYDATTMQLTSTDNGTVDLTVDGTTFNDAAFDFIAVKDGSTVSSIVAGSIYSQTAFDGTFSFFEAGTGNLILQVTFQDAVFSARNHSGNGAVFQSDTAANGGPAEDLVQFVAGPALDGVAVIGPPEGFSFALGQAWPAFNTDAEGQLKNFSANASFEADAVVPEPSTCLLVGMGLAGFVCVRRRRRS